MLIYGVGTDIVSVSRIASAINRSGGRFLLRVFTPAERDYCLARRTPEQCFAARFAGKEAVFKALGTGLAGCGWRDVEIAADPGGGPQVRLLGRAAGIALDQGIGRVLLSLTHEDHYAVAFAVAVRD